MNEIRQDQIKHEPRVTHYAESILWYAIIFVETVLAVRLATQVIFSETTNTFSSWIVSFTDPLLGFVQGVLPNVLSSQVITFIGMLVYWVFAAILMKMLVRIHFASEPTER